MGSRKRDEETFGLLCPICGTPNPETVKYCVRCGHWLLDTLMPAKPLTRKEFRRYFKRSRRQEKEFPPQEKRAENPEQKPANEESEPEGLEKGGKAGAVAFWLVIALIFVLFGLEMGALLSFLVVLLGIVSLIRPLKAIGIKTRGIGGLVLLAGVVGLFSFSALFPSPPSSAPLSALTSTITSFTNRFNPFLKSSPPNLEEYKAQCLTLSYGDLLEENEKYRGRKVQLSGQVAQVVQAGSRTILLVNITRDEGGSYHDTILVNYQPGTKEIPKDTIVNLWGEVKGKKTYTTALGRKITLPEIDAVDIEVLHEL